MSQLHTWAKLLGGEVCGTQILCPGPGHSASDRSLSVKMSATNDGFVVHSFCGDDPIVCREYVRKRLGMAPFKPNSSRKTVATYDFRDPTTGEVRYRKERVERADGTKSFSFKPAGRNGSDPLLYGAERLADVASGQPVFVVEGEKKVDRLRELGAVAVSGDSGASSKWLPPHADLLRDLRVVLWPDSDEPGEKCLNGSAASLRVVRPFGQPNGAKGRDVCDWRGGAEDLAVLVAAAEPYVARETGDGEDRFLDGVHLNDFVAYMPMHSYIFKPDGSMWPGTSVNARIPPIKPIGEDKEIPAAAWLDRNSPVEQMTWAPGLPQLIKGRLMAEGAWIEREGFTAFNLYQAPVAKKGNAASAKRWIDLANAIYPEDADHIIDWVAHRVQRPQEKINHALVLGGVPGIGKDSLLEPVKRAVGNWNFAETNPQQVSGRFNGFLKSVILRISEAHDTGDLNRYQFYEHLKSYIAAPPDTLRIDEKNLREYSIMNVTGVILTTNHKADGIFLPPDDRRHYVAWSPLEKSHLSPDEWTGLWNWYESGGFDDVAAYLRERDISAFNPKAPPTKTEAFWAIADAGRAPEDAELADLLDEMKNPDAFTTSKLVYTAGAREIGEWLRDRKNRRIIPHRLEKCGYEPVRNDMAKDGMWKVNGKRQAVYARSSLPKRDQLKAASELAGVSDISEVSENPSAATANVHHLHPKA